MARAATFRVALQHNTCPASGHRPLSRTKRLLLWRFGGMELPPNHGHLIPVPEHAGAFRVALVQAHRARAGWIRAGEQWAGQFTPLGLRVVPPSPAVLGISSFPDREGISPRAAENISTLLTGNGLAEIVRNSRGQLAELIFIPWGNVSVMRLQSGRLAYDISDPIGTLRTRRLLQGEVIPLRDRTDDGLLGRSRLARASETVAGVAAAKPFAKAMLDKGGYGRAFTSAGFGNRMRKWCDEAGLLHCSTHGLRKGISNRMALTGAGNRAIKSITGHSGDSEVALYTREVDQEALARVTMARLIKWEMANPHQG